MNMGPVVDEGAYKKVLEYIEIGKTEARLVAGGNTAGDSWLVYRADGICGCKPPAPVSHRKKFSGRCWPLSLPLISTHALAIANDTEYGLTGAVYSRNRAKLEKARREFHVGNLYLNRKCTGALVGVQPFGGFNMSGTDSKAGGADYLLLFLQAKVVAEKL